MNKIVSDRFSHYVLDMDCLDEEHRVISEAFKKLKNTLDIEFSSEDVLGLLRLITQHFEDEEILMRSIEYPHINFHIEVHANILLGLKEIMQSASITKDAIRLLEEAIYSHTETYDRQIANYIHR